MDNLRNWWFDRLKNIFVVVVNLSKNYWRVVSLKKKKMCIYKMVDISTAIWNNTGVSAIRIHENDDVNKTLLLLLCISDISKRWGGTNIYDLIDKEIKRWLIQVCTIHLNSLIHSKSEKKGKHIRVSQVLQTSKRCYFWKPQNKKLVNQLPKLEDQK